MQKTPRSHKSKSW